MVELYCVGIVLWWNCIVVELYCGGIVFCWNCIVVELYCGGIQHKVTEKVNWNF